MKKKRGGERAGEEGTESNRKEGGEKVGEGGKGEGEERRRYSGSSWGSGRTFVST